MADQKPKLKEIPKGKKLDYIWDYYKFHILIGIVLVISLVSILSTTVFRTKEDVYFLIAGEKVLPLEAMDTVKSEINKLNLDVNGDGKIKHDILNMGYTGIDAMTAVTDVEAEGVMAMKFAAVLSTGNYVIQIVDQKNAEEFINQGLGAKITDFPDEKFPNDGTYVKVPVTETKLDKAFGSYASKYFVLLRGKDAVSTGSAKKEKNYERQLLAFKEILK